MTAEHQVVTKNEQRSGTSRRVLLAAAMGGFAASASGLLLPDRLVDEAAARPGGSFGSQLGGRRGKDRRGRDKDRYRGHGDRNDKDKRRDGRGAVGFRNTALTVRNAGFDANHPGAYFLERFTATFYYQTKTGIDTYGHPIKAQGPFEFEADEAQKRSFRFAPDHFRCGALIQHHALLGGDLYVDVRNHEILAPRGRVLQGKDLDPPASKLGSEIIAEQGYAPNAFQRGSVDVGGDDNPNVSIFFDLVRNEDSDGFIEFILKVY